MLPVSSKLTLSVVVEVVELVDVVGGLEEVELEVEVGRDSAPRLSFPVLPPVPEPDEVGAGALVEGGDVVGAAVVGGLVVGGLVVGGDVVSVVSPQGDWWQW